MKKIAIKGSKDSNEQKEIIEILESLGGINTHYYLGNCTYAYYYINYNNIIMWRSIHSSQEYELLTLKEYKEKYMNKENNKELQIVIPEGYEIDKEQSSFEKIVFKKVKKKLTYEQVADELFKNKNHYFTDEDGNVIEANIGWHCPNVAPTKYQLERLLAINKLMNVAYYLNNGWEPNWEDDLQAKYFIFYNSKSKTINIDCNGCFNNGVVYFKSKELAEQAIEILGEETIKLALGVC